MACRIGIDVGGTFTDFVLFNAGTNQITHFKEPSVPGDPSLAVERGIPLLLQRAGVTARDIGMIVHGTTLAVNAIIQRRGAKVGLVVSRGNRDVLEIGRCALPNPYDFTAEKEEALVPRELVFETSARIAADGRVISPVDEDELARVAAQLQAAQVSSVAVMLLHSYRFPEMEHRVAESLRARLAPIRVTESARIWPERREYERSLVAVINAYVHPLMDAYLSRLQARVAALGITAPITITASNGGTLSLQTARERPIDTLLSGPASGVVAATRFAGAGGQKRIITFDMGGTSSDIALAKSGEPEYAMRTHIGDYPVVLPVVNVSAIGAGGGSIIWVDAHGVLKVGPHSAGADPGPACYGRGGTEPAVTDCYLVAGIIDPENFLGGRMKLNVAAARRALEHVADLLQMKGDDRAVRLAEAALRVATAVMATELQKNLARRGEDPRGFALMAFGGAGPTHATLLAREARLTTVIVPRSPGTFCAMGAILSDIKRDYIRSVRLPLTAEAEGVLRERFRELEEEAETWVRSEGAALEGSSFTASADLRLRGQSFELAVSVPDAQRIAPEAGALTELFHEAHERIYAFRDVASVVEVATIRIRVTGKLPELALPGVAEMAELQPRAVRHVTVDRQALDVPVYDRQALDQRSRIVGPAIVEQEDTTIWILPGWTATVDRVGNLIING